MEGGEEGGIEGGEGGRNGEGWRKEGWGGMEKEGGMKSEGGMGNRAHSPELVVARVPIVARVPVVARVLVLTRVLVVARVRSCALAVIREPRWPFWLVVVRALRGSWAMVRGGHRWVVVAGCGQWMVVGDHSWAVGGRRGRAVVVVVACVLSWALVLTWLVMWPATLLSSWLVVVESGW